MEGARQSWRDPAGASPARVRPSRPRAALAARQWVTNLRQVSHHPILYFPSGWVVSVSTFMERVAPVVDQTIAALAATLFIEDPIAGVRYSRATSIVSSAYKRHGRILETAIREGLRDSNRHRVWQEDTFRVSTAANALVNSLVGLSGEDACRQSALPYGERARTLQIDMIAYDDADRTIRAYEIKRGNGHVLAVVSVGPRQRLSEVQQRISSWPKRPQGQPSGRLPPQARNDARLQQRRLAGAGRTQDDVDAPVTLGAHLAQVLSVSAISRLRP